MWAKPPVQRKSNMSEKSELLKKVFLRTKQEVAKVIIGQEHVVDFF
jgi:hypothetical protein